ncbi:MAG: type II toxin-antitoxin system RelE/ParE family toxin [Nanoarchaeota archaeon]
MTFLIEYDKQPVSFLKKSDKNIAKRIFEKIEELLTKDPVPHTAVAIVGEHGVYRIRIGDFRAVYRINYENKKIIIISIDKRSKVYDK